MRSFVEPVIEVIELKVADIIATSTTGEDNELGRDD